MNNDDKKLIELAKKLLEVGSLKEIATLAGYSPNSVNDWYKNGLSERARYKIKDLILSNKHRIKDDIPKIIKILARIYDYKGFKSDSEFCEYYNINNSTLSTWKKRNKIPYEFLEKISQNENLSLDWLLNGDGYRDKQVVLNLDDSWKNIHELIYKMNSERKSLHVEDVGDGAIVNQGDGAKQEINGVDTLGAKEKVLLEYFRKADEIDKDRILLYAMQRVAKVEE